MVFILSKIHIVKLDDSHESAFLIQDMFPISDKYIEREYTIAGNHLRLTSEHAAKEIEQKARKVLGMLKRGIKFTPTQPDIQKIYERLQQDLPATHLYFYNNPGGFSLFSPIIPKMV